DFDTVMDVTAKALAKGPYLMGEQFTAADVVVGSTLRWGMMFKLVPERPEFTAYTNHLAARPAFQRPDATDKQRAAARGEGGLRVLVPYRFGGAHWPSTRRRCPLASISLSKGVTVSNLPALSASRTPAQLAFAIAPRKTHLPSAVEWNAAETPVG